MLEEQKKIQKRQIAVKVSISELLSGKYVREEGLMPNYIETADGKKISRVNIIGTVVFKFDEESLNYKNFVIDDGSGKISVRSFEKNFDVEKLGIGDTIMIVGRPREFSNERYLLPEIIRNINNRLWVHIRKLELDIVNKASYGAKTASEPVYERQKAAEDEIGTPHLLDSDLVYNLIKKLDAGNGVLIDEVIEKSNLKNSGKLINNLLENGEIFEIKPGRVKVLE